jgi:hypothetical protein
MNYPPKQFARPIFAEEVMPMRGEFGGQMAQEDNNVFRMASPKGYLSMP